MLCRYAPEDCFRASAEGGGEANDIHICLQGGYPGLVLTASIVRL